MRKAVLLMILLAVACTDPEKSTKLLQTHGYTQIEITGYRGYLCSEDDHIATGFRALAPTTGVPVSGAVCAGAFFKGATIRFDM